MVNEIIRCQEAQAFGEEGIIAYKAHLSFIHPKK